MAQQNTQDKLPGWMMGMLFPGAFEYTADAKIEQITAALESFEVPRGKWAWFQSRSRKVFVDPETSRFRVDELRQNRGVDYDSAIAFGELSSPSSGKTTMQGYVRYGFSFVPVVWLPPIMFVLVIATVVFVIEPFIWWLPVVATLIFAIAMYIVWRVVDSDRRRLLRILEAVAAGKTKDDLDES